MSVTLVPNVLGHVKGKRGIGLVGFLGEFEEIGRISKSLEARSKADTSKLLRSFLPGLPRRSLPNLGVQAAWH